MSGETISDDAALAGLVNLIVVLADNKYHLGRHLSEWAVGAPVLESSVAVAAVAQQHMGQARILYPLLDDLPSPVPAASPADAARHRRYNVSALDAPFATWPHTVAALGLVDPALNVLLGALEHTGHGDLARRVGRMLEEEPFQRSLAAGRVRELVGLPGGRDLLQPLVGDVLVEMLCWFGPADEPGLAAMVDEGLIADGNEALRQIYLRRIGPVFADAGIELGVERTEDGVWRHPELPWDRWNRLQRRLERS